MWSIPTILYNHGNYSTVETYCTGLDPGLQSFPPICEQVLPPCNTCEETNRNDRYTIPTIGDKIASLESLLPTHARIMDDMRPRYPTHRHEPYVIRHDLNSSPIFPPPSVILPLCANRSTMEGNLTHFCPYPAMSQDAVRTQGANDDPTSRLPNRTHYRHVLLNRASVRFMRSEALPIL